MTTVANALVKAGIVQAKLSGFVKEQEFLPYGPAVFSWTTSNGHEYVGTATDLIRFLASKWTADIDAESLR